MRDPDQTYYDALLIKCWREDAPGIKLASLTKHEFGMWPNELPLLRCRAFFPNCRIRVFVAQQLHALSECLWNCKTDADFISALRSLKGNKLDCAHNPTNERYRREAFNQQKQARMLADVKRDYIRANKEAKNSNWATVKPTS